MTMNWKEGAIDGVDILELASFQDHRGWLSELFRSDEIDPAIMPAMAYISVTLPGIARGPHEHRTQTDMFAFFHGSYTLFMWDDRKDSPTFGNRWLCRVGVDAPCRVVIPPGVVHAYRNDGSEPAYVLNMPNRLYAGQQKSEPVDEIRHEDRDDNRFPLDP